MRRQSVNKRHAVMTQPLCTVEANYLGNQTREELRAIQERKKACVRV
jgi:hypothetical protein